MAEFVLKYADPRGEMHQQVAEAGSERELRDRYSQQGFLIYSIKPRREIAGMAIGGGQKEDQPGEVSDLQSAVCHADSRRTADSESSRSSVGASHRPQAVAAHQGRPGRGEERIAALGRVRAAGRVSAHLRDLGAGGREERRAGRGAGPFYHLSETGAVGAEEADGVADLPVSADCAGDLPDGVSDHLRGPEVRRTL